MTRIRERGWSKRSGRRKTRLDFRQRKDCKKSDFHASFEPSVTVRVVDIAVVLTPVGARYTPVQEAAGISTRSVFLSDEYRRRINLSSRCWSADGQWLLQQVSVTCVWVYSAAKQNGVDTTHRAF